MSDMSFAGLLAAIAESTVEYISSLGYWGLFIGMAIESANIPLPSELILPFGGYLVSTGKLQFVQAALAGTLGGIAGSILSYFLGLWGGRPFLLKYGRYIGISQKHFDQAESWFLRYGEVTVFFTRLMPVVRTFISLPAGISGMNFWRFVFYSFIGSLPWCFFLTYLGLKMGQNWEDLKYWFHRLDVVVIAAIVILVIFYCLRKKRN
ncbi:MAG: SNARE associated Golgi protein-like protein [Desulfotomaculum sp. 46_80]|nr:MAG: SNARE associated Golgi protein-like protein [Desulfotomaculum sp. 46_80]